MVSVPLERTRLVTSNECRSNSGPHLSSLHSLCDQPLHVVADQIAELIQPLGVLMRGKLANRHGRDQSAEHSKFVRPHRRIEKVRGKSIGDKCDKGSLQWKELNRWSRTVTALTKDINCA